MSEVTQQAIRDKIENLESLDELTEDRTSPAKT